MNNVDTGADVLGEKVGDTQQVKNHANRGIKVCSFMEEDNFVNSHGNNKQSSQQDNINIDKINAQSIAGMTPGNQNTP